MSGEEWIHAFLYTLVIMVILFCIWLLSSGISEVVG